jgi:hypothetical protein
MTSVASIARVLQTVLTTTADEAARFTGCVRRQGTFTGSTLCQTLVLGWLGAPRAPLSSLCQTAAACGVSITPQGLHQRFTVELAACLELVLDACVQAMVQAPERAVPLLTRFPDIVLRDSTAITLPAALADLWSGCGSVTGETAVLKLSVGYSLR